MESKMEKPLREALDYLRDHFAEIFEQEGAKYFNTDVWEVRNRYIEVILDRTYSKIKNSKKIISNLTYLKKKKSKVWNFLKFSDKLCLCTLAAAGSSLKFQVLKPFRL